MTDLVLTLIGLIDRLVEAVAEVIAGHEGNWLESRMAHLAGKVCWHPARRSAASPGGAAFRGAGRIAGTRSARDLPSRASWRRPPAMDQAGPWIWNWWGSDRPGIVREISQILPAVAPT